MRLVCGWGIDSIVPSLARILTKQHGIRGPREYVPLENPWKCHFRDSKFQNVAKCHDPQEFVPWCEFLSRVVLIIICLLLNTFWQPFSQVQVLDVCTTAVWIPKNIHSYWVLMKLFLMFFASLALVHKPCRLMGFLLILKESHEGKNVSYVTIAVLLICFRFLNYVDTFTHCPMTAYFLKNLTQLRVYWTTEWKMRLSNWRRLSGPEQSMKSIIDGNR